MAEPETTPSAATSPSSSAPASPSTPASAPAASAAATPAQTPPASTTTASPTAEPKAKPDTYSFLPDTFWNAAKGEPDTDKLNETFTRAAADESRRLTLPKTIEEYKAELPPDFELPKGADGKPVAFQFDETDPALVSARQAALEMGLDQSAFSRLLGIHAGNQLRAQQQQVAYRDAEIKKLGDAGPARVDAVLTFAQSALGPDAAKTIRETMWTADQVKVWEKVIQMVAAPGGTRFSQAHRETADADGKIPGMAEAKTFEQKRALQDKFNSSRSPAAARR